VTFVTPVSDAQSGAERCQFDCRCTGLRGFFVSFILQTSPAFSGEKNINILIFRQLRRAETFAAKYTETARF
jgi:hypothetical protein